MTVVRLYDPTCRYQVALGPIGLYRNCGKAAGWAHEQGNLLVPMCSSHKAVITRRNPAATFLPVEVRV